MTQRVTINVVEVNRQRLVSLEGLTAALAEVVHAIDSSEAAARAGEPELLEPLRTFVRALRGLLAQALPEGRYPAEVGQDVELEATATELEALAEELERVRGFADELGDESAAVKVRGELEDLEDRLRVRSRSR